jgi:hypothetical protein
MRTAAAISSRVCLIGLPFSAANRRARGSRSHSILAATSVKSAERKCAGISAMVRLPRCARSRAQAACWGEAASMSSIGSPVAGFRTTSTAAVHAASCAASRTIVTSVCYALWSPLLVGRVRRFTTRERGELRICARRVIGQRRKKVELSTSSSTAPASAGTSRPAPPPTGSPRVRMAATPNPAGRRRRGPVGDFPQPNATACRSTSSARGRTTPLGSSRRGRGQILRGTLPLRPSASRISLCPRSAVGPNMHGQPPSITVMPRSRPYAVAVSETLPPPGPRCIQT